MDFLKRFLIQWAYFLALMVVVVGIGAGGGYLAYRIDKMFGFVVALTTLILVVAGIAALVCELAGE